MTLEIKKRTERKVRRRVDYTNDFERDMVKKAI